jgi:ribonuclease HII
MTQLLKREQLEYSYYAWNIGMGYGTQRRSAKANSLIDITTRVRYVSLDIW